MEIIHTAYYYFPGPKDYSETIRSWIFFPVTRFSLRVPIINDDIAEPVKNFIITATLLTEDVPGVRLAPEKCTVTILDDDSKK